MPFPIHRMRRLRGNETIRRMVRQTRLSVDNLILPLFVRPGRDIQAPVASMPGQFQLSVDRLVATCGQASELGIPAVLLFGLPQTKDEVGSAAWDDNGIVQQATRALKEALPALAVICDLCFCEYTSHGHCGVLSHGARPPGGAVPSCRDPGLPTAGTVEGGCAPATVDNDATLANLARQAVSLARAGADLIAPSDMMDGRVAAVRRGLDEAGFSHTPIMSYAAKQASAFYGPFRDAAESAPAFGDRRSYQMDPANGDEAVREVALDVEEGADIVMVKPALPCLDLIWRVKQRFALPTAAYQVSGEYAMIKAAAANGWLDEKQIALETLTAVRRAGADLIVTYFALDAARWIQDGRVHFTG